MFDLPDPAQEIRDLREENERLRSKLRGIRGIAGAETDYVSRGTLVSRLHTCWHKAKTVLNETTTDPNET